MSIEVMKQALDNICGAKLCEINSMSSRAEMIRLMDKAITTLRQAIEDAEKQDPVCVSFIRQLVSDKDGIKTWKEKPLYVAPTKREWVGLTDEERHEIREWQKIQEELGPVWAPMMLYLYIAIEAKLKEKNT
jgi:hypothetical protein